LLEFNRNDLLGDFIIEVALLLYKNKGGVPYEMLDEVSVG